MQEGIMQEGIMQEGIMSEENGRQDGRQDGQRKFSHPPGPFTDKYHQGGAGSRTPAHVSAELAFEPEPDWQALQIQGCPGWVDGRDFARVLHLSRKSLTKYSQADPATGAAPRYCGRVVEGNRARYPLEVLMAGWRLRQLRIAQGYIKLPDGWMGVDPSTGDALPMPGGGVETAPAGTDLVRMSREEFEGALIRAMEAAQAPLREQIGELTDAQRQMLDNQTELTRLVAQLSRQLADRDRREDEARREAQERPEPLTAWERFKRALRLG